MEGIESNDSTAATCPICLSLWQPYWTLDPLIRESYFETSSSHIVPYTSLLRSISAYKCRSCRVVGKVLECYSSFLLQDGGVGNEVRLRFGKVSVGSEANGRTGRGYRYLCFSGEDGGDGERESMTLGEVLEVEVWGASSPCPWGELRHRSSRAISGYTGSVKAVARVKRWLSECVERHPKCGGATANSTYTPTRLVRITSSDTVRLCVPDGPVPAYACLSHCWGKIPIVRTTTANYTSHLTSIKTRDLPLTFQHAITFTHALGLEYLWIDSLCILQDSASDWHHEASKMPDIYENAFVTLAATMAYDPSQGSFARAQERFMSRIVEVEDEGTKYELHCREPLDDIVWDKPLQDRGWAFQERILSKRIVHFMEEELWWECHTLATCECGSSDHGPRVDFGVRPDVRGLRRCTSLMEVERQWEGIVREYSAKSLTFATDVFPALQGLARLVPDSMGVYLAGHWRSTLVHSLCWAVEKTDAQVLQQDIGKRGEHWRAPSWSWASAVMAMEWSEGFQARFFADVVSASTVPQGSEPTGQLKYGELVIRGKCLRGRVAGKKSRDPWRAATATMLTADPAELEASLTPRLYLFDSFSAMDLDDEDHEWWGFPHWDFRIEEELGSDVLVMKIEETGRNGGQQSWLVLKASRKSGNDGLVFERIGLLKLDEELDEWGETFFQSLEDLNELYDNVAIQMQVRVI